MGGQLDIVRSIAFSPDGKSLAAVSADVTILLWDPASGEERRRIDAGRQLDLLAYSPDGKTIAATSVDGTIHLWDSATGKEQRQLSGHKKASRHIAYSPDGKLLATSMPDGTIRLWDVTTGQQVRLVAEGLGERSRPIALGRTARCWPGVVAMVAFVSGT